MPSLLIVLRVALAGVFVLAAWAKLRHPERTRTDIAALGLPGWMVAPVSFALPVIELVVAALLLIEPLHEIGSIGAFGLLGLFTAVLVINLLRGRRPACACFGALASAPIGWTSVARNVALMVVAGGLIWLPWAGVEAPVPSSTLLALVGAGVGLAWLVLLTRQNGRLLVRLEQLERQTGAPPSQPAAAIGPLAVGATVPPLGLNDARGRPFDLAGLRGTPVLLLFLDRACSHCRPLLAELREAVLDDASARLVVISESGSLRHDLPPEVPLVVDVGWTSRELFGVRGTPAAASIDADGVLAQAGVHGTSAVRAALLRARLLTEETDHELDELARSLAVLSPSELRRLIMVLGSPLEPRPLIPARPLASRVAREAEPRTDEPQEPPYWPPEFPLDAPGVEIDDYVDCLAAGNTHEECDQGLPWCDIKDYLLTRVFLPVIGCAPSRLLER